MTFEPPVQRHFDPRVGWTQCGWCNALMQAPLYDMVFDEENQTYTEVDFMNDDDATAIIIGNHYNTCTSITPFTNDTNAYYANPSDNTDPEPKCYFESCDY